MGLSEANQDYLKAIYHLRAAEKTVSTVALAARLGVAAPSATAMIKKLASLHLVSHTPYHGVELTPAGEKIALEVIRHHRLVETYLTEFLGLDWIDAHKEAERWEHVLSEEVEERMAAVLGNPTHDPHGSPIPSREGRIAVDAWLSLAEAQEGQTVFVRRVTTRNAEVLRHLREVGLVPDTRVQIQRAVKLEGVLRLRIGEKERAVGLDSARCVYVEIEGNKA